MFKKEDLVKYVLGALVGSGITALVYQRMIKKILKETEEVDQFVINQLHKMILMVNGDKPIDDIDHPKYEA